MKKRIVLSVALVLVALVLTGCAVTQRVVAQPFSASVSFPAEGTYKILGRVDYAPAKNTAGYLDFLSYAKSVYPETVDLVNILVDTEETYESSNGLLGSSSVRVDSSYLMSGIAIKYLP